ncbi:tyrosine--tRNA ligase [Acidianus sp. RZ1]|uniref:tyrosine--tRNA ligase n=1 Tax=Acidianus sp. RZ1 TaxID=1540082 RepID=UPI0014919042|nr:tyrosine--tRNA ligase [Acidianus sp. RZ1]NON62222.1 tyrosine--tRNA ligase [Acidianus sp. RZ1]
MENRLSLISRNTEEIVTLDELKKKLESGNRLTGYIGFEPSGIFHIGWLIWAQKLRDLIEAGVQMKVLVATWHAWINDKLGGDMELIRSAGKYAIDVLNAYGINTSKFQVIDAEELVSDKNYWENVIRVAKSTTLARMKRSLTIMGRKSDEAELDTSKLFYPAMQVSDIFYLDVDIALGGTDQRKAHMLAREIAEKFSRKKVIAIHTPLLVGLKGGQRMENVEIDEVMAEAKMSKSKPETAIFVTDTEEEVESKIKAAYCPKGVIEFNPVLQIDKLIVFSNFNSFTIERESKYGGNITFNTYGELEKAFAEGKVHPMDLKTATAKMLNQILDPIRKKVNTDMYKEIISSVNKNITR